MENFQIKSTPNTPEINFNGNEGKFHLSGKSYPENVNIFYEQVLEYIEQYKKNPQKSTLIEFNWLYFNTATAKIIIKIIMSLKDLSQNFKVKWYCKKDFDLMISKGEEIKEILEIDLEVIVN